MLSFSKLVEVQKEDIGGNHMHFFGRFLFMLVTCPIADFFIVIRLARHSFFKYSVFGSPHGKCHWKTLKPYFSVP